jgi:hypothetical protein
MANNIKIVRKHLTQQLHSLDSLLATTDYDYEDARASYEEQMMYVEEQLQVLDKGGIKALKAFRKMVQEQEAKEA